MPSEKRIQFDKSNSLSTKQNPTWKDHLRKDIYGTHSATGGRESKLTTKINH